MHIVIDCRMLHGPKRGIGHYLHHLVWALAEIDSRNHYTLFYVSGRADPDQIVRIPAANFDTRVLRMPNGAFVRLFGAEGGWARLTRAIPWGYDLVHEPGFESLPLAGRTVVTIHDLNVLRQADTLPPEIVLPTRRRMERVVRTARQIITDSEHTRQDVIRMLDCPPEKVHRVYLGVDPAALQIAPEEADRELAALGVTTPFVLSLGDLLKGKNHLSAVRGWARLSSRLQCSHRYVIAGMLGEAIHELRAEIAALELQESVLLTGYVCESARRALLNRASALVFPSLYEGFGLPPLEAMACGVPTISARSTSVPEVVGEAGLLIDDFLDPAAWAQGLEDLLTDEPLRGALIQRGHDRAAEFPWQRTARETLRVYEQAVTS